MDIQRVKTAVGANNDDSKIGKEEEKKGNRNWVRSSSAINLKANLNQTVLTWDFPVLNVYLLV